MEFIQLIGMSNVEARVRALATSLKQKLAQIPRVRLKTNLEPALSAGVIKFRLLGVETPHAYDSLWAKHRVALAMTPSSSPANEEGLRFCPHIYNSWDEIDRAVAAVRELTS